MKKLRRFNQNGSLRSPRFAIGLAVDESRDILSEVEKTKIPTTGLERAGFMLSCRAMKFEFEADFRGRKTAELRDSSLLQRGNPGKFPHLASSGVYLRWVLDFIFPICLTRPAATENPEFLAKVSPIPDTRDNLWCGIYIFVRAANQAKRKMIEFTPSTKPHFDSPPRVERMGFGALGQFTVQKKTERPLKDPVKDPKDQINAPAIVYRSDKKEIHLHQVYLLSPRSFKTW